MAVPPNYFITGVWKNDKGRITHVFLHPNTADGYGRGTKTLESIVIAKIKNKESVMTFRWDYATAKFKRGAYVKVVEENKIDFLRTVPDATVIDNLDNMIDMDGFI